MAQDVSRLLLEVDASIALAERNFKRLATSVDQGAGSIERSAKRAEGSLVRMDRSMASIGQRKQGLQQLSFQIGDVSSQLASGTRPAQVFAQQLGQVVQALQLMGGEGNKFLSFLAGPWGAVVSGAVIILASMADKLFQTEKATDGATKAKSLHKMTVDELVKAIDAESDALAKSIQSSRDSERAAYAAARAKQAEAEARIKTTLAALQEAKALAEIAAQTAGASDLGLNIAIQRRADVAALEKQIKTLEASASKARGGVAAASIPLIQRGVEARLDPRAGAELVYEKALTALNKQFTSGAINATNYARKLAEAERKRDAELERLSKASRKTRDGDPALPKVTQAEVIDLLKDTFGAGTRITSTNRSAARNKAAGGAANSYHLTGQGIDFVPAEGLKAFDREMLRKAAEARGIKLVEVLGPGDKGHANHGHVAFSRRRLGADQVRTAQERSARRAEAEAEKRVRLEERFNADVAQLDNALLAARSRLVSGTEARAKADKGQIEAEANEAIRRIQADKDLTETQRLTLVEKTKALANQRKANIDEEVALKLAEEQLEVQSLQRDGEIEALRHLQRFAPTRLERLNIEREIIDALYAQQLAEIENSDLSEQIKDEKKRQLLAQRNRAVSSAEQDAMSPIEQMRGQYSDITDELEDLKARGIMGAVDALTQLTNGFGSFRDAAVQAIGQVVQELIRLQLMKAIFSIFGAATGAGAGGAGMAGAGFLSALTNPANGLAGAREFGGPVTAGKPYLVGEKRPEVFIPRQSGVIIPSVGQYMKGGSGVSIHAPFTVNGGMSEQQGRKTARQHARILRQELNRSIK